MQCVAVCCSVLQLKNAERARMDARERKKTRQRDRETCDPQHLHKLICTFRCMCAGMYVGVYVRMNTHVHMHVGV